MAAEQGWRLVVPRLAQAIAALVQPVARPPSTSLPGVLVQAGARLQPCCSIQQRGMHASAAAATAAAGSMAPPSSTSGFSAAHASDQASISESHQADASTPSTSGAAAAAAAAAALPDPKPELVDLFLSEDSLSQQERKRLARRQLIKDFQRHPADVGSPQVMVAVWTQRIRELEPHFSQNRKELAPMRHLQMLVGQRKRLLTWMRKADFESYQYAIHKLGLQDIYTPTGFADRYREGLRHGDPVTDDSLLRRRFNFHRKYRQDKTSMWKRLRPQLIAEDPVLAARDAAAPKTK